MAKWLSKINWSGGQCRITIPTRVVAARKFYIYSHVEVDDNTKDVIQIRGLEYDKSKENQRRDGGN